MRKQPLYYYDIEMEVIGKPHEYQSCCIRGYRKPTIPEATKFLKKNNCLYDDEVVVAVLRISKEYAEDNFHKYGDQELIFDGEECIWS